MSSRISIVHESSGLVDVSPWLSDPRPLPSIPPLAPSTPSGGSPLPTILGASSLVLAVAALAIAMAGARGTDRTTAETHAQPATASEAVEGDAVRSERGAPEPAGDDQPTAPIAADPTTADEGTEPAAPSGATGAATISRTANRPTRRLTPAPSLRRDWDGAVAGTDDPPATDAPEASSLDALLDRALRGGGDGAGQTTESLPETPDRGEVLSVLRGLSDEVAQCREQSMEPGVATTRIVIDGATGRVHRATVEGELAWTTTGACIGRTLSLARFPRFARDRFEVEFPYRL